mmetsp:Transcript_138844/g.443269  ORF Transcript_138844/g.443269 Transcript_138844/m.443269 type:complete len:337 (-) Transcript_138844:1141-2151(-)
MPMLKKDASGVPTRGVYPRMPTSSRLELMTSERAQPELLLEARVVEAPHQLEQHRRRGGLDQLLLARPVCRLVEVAALEGERGARLRLREHRAAGLLEVGAGGAVELAHPPEVQEVGCQVATPAEHDLSLLARGVARRRGLADGEPERHEPRAAAGQDPEARRVELAREHHEVAVAPQQVGLHHVREVGALAVLLVGGAVLLFIGVDVGDLLVPELLEDLRAAQRILVFGEEGELLERRKEPGESAPRHRQRRRSEGQLLDLGHGLEAREGVVGLVDVLRPNVELELLEVRSHATQEPEDGAPGLGRGGSADEAQGAELREDEVREHHRQRAVLEA